MKMEHIQKEIEDELTRARGNFPLWRLDPIHGTAVVAEEAGEVVQAALDFYDGIAGAHVLKQELIHTATMAIRFLLNFEKSVSWTEAFNKGRKEALERQKKLKGEKNGKGKI